MPARGGDRPIVVVGGGLAGGNAAATLREEGFKGRVVLIGRVERATFVTGEILHIDGGQAAGH
jgi:succinate dehydrogenase/fumarate reductase flavoprotein subunit